MFVNVAFVSNVVHPFVTGGAQKRVHEIGTRLVEQGHEVTVYGRHFWEGPKQMIYEGLDLRAVAPAADLYTDDRRSITEALDFSTRLVRPLHRQLQADEHDLIVVSVFPYFPVGAAVLAQLQTDVPVVTTWHEVWKDYWMEYLGKLGPIGTVVERVTAHLPQHPIAVSGVTADRLADIGPTRESISVVPNGIDVDRIRKAPLPDSDDDGPNDVLFAGRLIDDKNVDDLLAAFERVADRHDATLGIIGDGPEADRLRQQATTLQHSDQIEFLGFLDSYDDVLGQMRAARVFATPSTREGFGITVAEAMAADCTVIAADHPESAASEVLGDAGFLVQPTTTALSDTLDRALAGEQPQTSPQERAAMYDWDSVANQAESVYKEALYPS